MWRYSPRKLISATFEFICNSVTQSESQVIKTPRNGKHIIIYKEVTEVLLSAVYYIEHSHFIRIFYLFF